MFTLYFHSFIYDNRGRCSKKAAAPFFPTKFSFRKKLFTQLLLWMQVQNLQQIAQMSLKLLQTCPPNDVTFLLRILHVTTKKLSEMELHPSCCNVLNLVRMCRAWLIPKQNFTLSGNTTCKKKKAQWILARNWCEKWNTYVDKLADIARKKRALTKNFVTPFA